MISFLIQNALAILGGGSALAGICFLIWRSFQKWVQQMDERESYEEKIEILKKQRDSGIHTVTDADELWDSYKPKR